MPEETGKEVFMRLATDPPNSSRKVVLRFGDNGERDCFGFYCAETQAWYKMSTKNAVHPTHWCEASFAIYQVVEETGRVVFDECTMEEALHFADAIKRRCKTQIVAMV